MSGGSGVLPVVHDNRRKEPPDATAGCNDREPATGVRGGEGDAGRWTGAGRGLSPHKRQLVLISFLDTVSGKYRSICGRRLRGGSERPREMSGSVVGRTWSGTNLNSCHRLGVASGSLEVVPPGGKGACVGDRSFGQQGREQLAVQPGPGALAAALRKMPALRDRLEALEHQLHLPPETVPVEDRLRGEPRCGEGGEDDHAFRELQRLRLRSPSGEASRGRSRSPRRTS